MRKRPLTTIFLASLLAVGLASAPQRAVADGAYEGEVLVILASEDEGPIDPALKDIAALKKAPFNGFHALKILSRPKVRLDVGKPVEVSLPKGRTLQLVLDQVAGSGRLRMKVSIRKTPEKNYLPLVQVVAKPSEYFFVAGQKYQDENNAKGTLIIGIRVAPTPS